MLWNEISWGNKPLEIISKKILDLQAHENYNVGNWKQKLKTENSSSINKWWEIKPNIIDLHRYNVLEAKFCLPIWIIFESDVKIIKSLVLLIDRL